MDSAEGDIIVTLFSFHNMHLWGLLDRMCRGYGSSLWRVRGYCGKSSTGNQSFLEVAANCFISRFPAGCLLFQFYTRVVV